MQGMNQGSGSALQTKAMQLFSSKTRMASVGAKGEMKSYASNSNLTALPALNSVQPATSSSRMGAVEMLKAMQDKIDELEARVTQDVTATTQLRETVIEKATALEQQVAAAESALLATINTATTSLEGNVNSQKDALTAEINAAKSSLATQVSNSTYTLNQNAAEHAEALDLKVTELKTQTDGRVEHLARWAIKADRENAAVVSEIKAFTDGHDSQAVMDELTLNVIQESIENTEKLELPNLASELNEVLIHLQSQVPADHQEVLSLGSNSDDE